MENKPVKSSLKTPARKPRGRAVAPRTQLDPERWVDEAIDVLAKEGVSGLRVEVLTLFPYTTLFRSRKSVV